MFAWYTVPGYSFPLYLSPEHAALIGGTPAPSGDSLMTLDEWITLLDDHIAGEYIQADQKGMASGVATLDAGGKVPAGQVPDLSATYAARVTPTAHAPAFGLFFPEAEGAAA